ncbi:MAG: cupin domain-containing protein [Candidatus Saccharibacteria bacterium]|nr:cupin domain-containing protein [Candidatus Saccharibacteria bacterium]
MKMKSVSNAKPVEKPQGIIRRTLAYNDEAMLCHFVLKKGAEIPLHDHRATQIGYIIKGKVKLLAENPANETEAGEGDAYVFSAFVKHGTQVLEDSEYVEVFVPVRDEYKDF